MKALITGAWKYTNEQIEYLKKKNFEIYFMQNEKENTDIDFEQIDYVVCNALFLYHDIKLFKNLKVIQLTSAGLDRVPLDYIKENHIKLFNARGVYSIPIAEFIICKILDIYKNSFEFYNNQKQHLWCKNRNILELYNKNVTIVGYGNIGKEIAKRLKAFAVNVNVVDIVKKEDSNISKYFDISNLKLAVSNSDIVIITLPLTVETKGIFNKEILGSLKNEAILVNMARGEIIVEDELIEVLKKGKIKAAILDVFQEEPLERNSELWNLENLIITPHNSFVGENNNERFFEIVKLNLEDAMI